MSEFQTHPRSARPMRKPYGPSYDFNPDITNMGHDWTFPPEDPRDGFHFKMRDFCEFLDTGSDEYRPAPPRREEKCRFAHYDEASNEMIDLRKSKRDLPKAGQIIWDDIGDGMMVESLSWSQSDVEREIETWDQRVKEVDAKFQRNVAWDDGDMIRFEDPRDVYLPRRSGSIGCRDDRWRSSRKVKEVKRGSLQSCVKQQSDVQKDGRNMKEVRKARSEEVPKKPSIVDASEILPAPPTDNIRFNVSRSPNDARYSCSHSYSSFKQVSTFLTKFYSSQSTCCAKE